MMCEDRLGEKHKGQKSDICGLFRVKRPDNNIESLNTALNQAINEHYGMSKADKSAISMSPSLTKAIKDESPTRGSSGCPSGQGMATWKNKKMGCMTPSQYELWNAQMTAAHRANRSPISVYNAGPGMQQQNMQHQINMLQMKQRHIQMYGY